MLDGSVISFSLVALDLQSFILFLLPVDSPRDSVQFIEWSPTSSPRALLIANFHGSVTIWTQPSLVSHSSGFLSSLTLIDTIRTA